MKGVSHGEVTETGTDPGDADTHIHTHRHTDTDTHTHTHTHTHTPLEEGRAGSCLTAEATDPGLELFQLWQ
jgi:hypothetical protein